MLNNSVDVAFCTGICDKVGADAFWQLFVKYVNYLNFIVFYFLLHSNNFVYTCHFITHHSRL